MTNLKEGTKVLIRNPREGLESIKNKIGTIRSQHTDDSDSSIILYHVDFDDTSDILEESASLRKDEIEPVYTTVDVQTMHGAWNGKSYTVRHGDPFDRGGADFYYGYPRKPHYYIGATGTTPIVEEADMTDEQIEAYHAGYSAAADQGDQKDWG